MLEKTLESPLECKEIHPSPGDLPNPAIEPRSLALQADSLPVEPQEKPEYQGRRIQNRLLSCLGLEVPVHVAQRLQAKGCFPPGATQNVPKRLSSATSSWKPPLIAPLLGVPHSPMVTGFDHSFGNSSPPDSEPPRAGLAWGRCRNPWSQGSVWGAGHEAAVGLTERG